MKAGPSKPGRRRFLIGSALAGGALYVGYRFVRERDRLGVPATLPLGDGDHALNGWLRIRADGTVTVAVPRQEMGQGIYTALAMLVAEELDADWSTVRVEQAPVDEIYRNVTLLGDQVPVADDDMSMPATVVRWIGGRVVDALGVQVTGGSSSTRDAWEPMRVAGAAAREMLVAAAADTWQVAREDCTTAAGAVTHTASGRRLAYGDLAQAAAKRAPPRRPVLKQAQDYRLIGQPLRRLDLQEKVDGSARFGLDVRLPGMLYAAIRHCPTFGGTLENYDPGGAPRLPGVKQIVPLASALAVVAETYWGAQRALAQISIDWNEGPHASLTTADLFSQLTRDLDQGRASTYRQVGDCDAAFAAAAQIVTAEYRAPLLAHAAMEPINCTARVGPTDCEVWVPNQFPSLLQWVAAKTAGVAAEHATLHTPYLGGAFGRRAEIDVVVEAVTIAKATGGRPVQLIWSREEDMQHDCYRPPAVSRFRAALDATRTPTAWSNRIAGPSVFLSYIGRLAPWAAVNLSDDQSNAEGAADLPYEFASQRVEHVLSRIPVPVGYWRSVGHSHNAFFTECFMDELAHAAGADPVAFRAALLKSHPRHLHTLQLAAQRAQWDTAPAPGVGRGIALHDSFRSICAQVAEVRVTPAGEVLVERVVCAIDCGTVVNPDTVVAQMEGSIIFGMTAALYGEITLDKGRVTQRNFPDYDMVRMTQAPIIEVHLVHSRAAPGGVGEPGTPPIAPAIANAVFAATGHRVRSLPIRVNGGQPT